MPIPSLKPLIIPAVAICLMLSPALLMTAPQQGSASEKVNAPSSTQASFEDFSRKATAAREAGQSDEAVRNYHQALKVRPDWTEGWFYLGILYSDAARYADAIPSFQKVVDAHPELGPAWAYLGLAEYQTGAYQLALAHLQHARQFGFADVPAVEKVATYHLALLLNQNGQFEDAWELLASKFGNGPLANQTKTALALALLRVPLLPESIDPAKDALIDDAGQTAGFLVQGNFDQALSSFRQMLRNYPTTPFLHYAYGSALMFQSHYDEAKIQLQEETRITPQSALPYVRLAIIELKTHRAPDALPLAQHAVQLAPQSSTAHQLLGRILAELGKNEEAGKETALAEKLKPEKPQADPEVARIYVRQAVIPASTTSTASEPFEELARHAAQAASAGRNEEAISTYKDALAIRPQWDEGWLNLGMLYYITGRYQDAAPALKNSIAVNSQLGGSWVFLGLCEFATKDFRNAYRDLERGGKLNWHGTPEAMATASFTLAQLRNANGEFESAITALKPQIAQGQLNQAMTIVLGMSLLHIPLLQDQVDPSQRALLAAAGQTAAFLYGEKYNQAFQSFEQLVKKYPDTPFLHYSYATALDTFSRYDEAEAQLREELRIVPKSALSYMRLSAISLKLHRPEQALNSAQQAVELDPQAAGGHELLGRSLLDLDKTEPAIKELEIAAKLAPNYPDVHFNLARAYSKAKRLGQAEQERRIFAELNASLEREQNIQGSQAYGVPHSRIPATDDSSAPASHPE